MSKLNGKVAIVTGASRGIGQTIAELFAEEGAKVICSARTLVEGDHQLEGSINRTVSLIKERGGEAHPIAADVSNPDDCIRLIDETRKVYGPVDILINNAALNYYIPIQDYPLNRWLRAFSVNLHAPFMLSQAALPDMIAKQSGSIVNISSGAAIGPGRGPYPNSTARGGVMYGASKAALERFTQGLAEEVFSDGISVTALSPSQVVPTPGTIYHKLVDGLDDPRGESPMLMAKATLLLASEATEVISGRVTYSQEILQEFEWITDGQGRGIDTNGSGYSQI
jgi:NAD(P)-dependent dehydrogenase (short-subunit alcohol dehydrogenase family)